MSMVVAENCLEFCRAWSVEQIDETTAGGSVGYCLYHELLTAFRTTPMSCNKYVFQFSTMIRLSRRAKKYILQAFEHLVEICQTSR